MPDDPGTTPHDRLSFPAGGPVGIFSFVVKGPRDAAVVCTVEHRNLADTDWSNAGSLAMFAPAESAFRVSGLREELRITCACVGGPGADAIEVRVLPPRWLPC